MKTNKERFVTLLEALQRQDCLDESFNKAINSMNMCHSGFYYDNSLLVNAIISVANSLLPHPEEDWVSWFAYDQNFGDVDKPNAWMNEVEYTIRKPEELWDFCYLNLNI